ncbi:prepilin peptidase [Cognatishimia activa]|uniref:Flp pilus assembly protein, protease CpaA n=1 Tax=Cognatishimia activa TaxID=1715691 RepID=A0A0P1IWG1_9RHOB|nr:prepilin peptidase [Cognatishimia activa]CUI64693.1 Flp pilus assembly protein, protease CpaA [Cognatishimia activa]CUK26398.1 Flp pilus assembly protein, protease CpaA [Cognatishimia activa]
MQITLTEALWFLPFVAPICLYVAWTDMKMMKITNKAVMVLFLVFAVVGVFALPFETYLWRYLHLIVILLVGIVLNAGGLVGAGDAKFAAAAAPFIPLGDATQLAVIFASTLIAAWVTHKLAKHSPVRRMVPEWESWDQKKDFPMGLALGGTLLIYLLLGALS